MTIERKRRGNSRYVILFLMLTVALYLVYFGINHAIQHISLFKINQITIKGNENLDKSFLLNMVKDFSGENLFSITQNDVKTKYENVIRVKSVKLKKVLPNKLIIQIKERKGEFFVKTQNGLLIPIDNDKMVLDNDRNYPNEILPIIDTQLVLKKNLFYGKPIKDNFVDSIFVMKKKLYEIDKSFISNISEFYLENNDIVMIDKMAGYKLILGKNNLEDKIKRFNFLKLNTQIAANQRVILKWNEDIVIQPEAN